MFEIAEANFLTSAVKLFRIVAPRIARKHKSGQFVIVRVHEHGERIPLTIADTDSTTGTITIVVQGVGKTTKLLNSLNAGDSILDVVGPLGNPSEVQAFGSVVLIGGGVGTAITYPTAIAMQQANNHVIGIVGARTEMALILVDPMRATTDELFVMTDDGSFGERGIVTHKLAELIDAGRQIDHVLAIGPISMMQAVADVTRPNGIRTIVSLNPIMVDGTGMCGGCRVTVGGESKFACVDGPEFDAHQVDFQNLMRRNRLYRDQEQAALEQYLRVQHSGNEKVEMCRLQNRHPEVGAQKNS